MRPITAALRDTYDSVTTLLALQSAVRRHLDAVWVLTISVCASAAAAAAGYHIVTAEAVPVTSKAVYLFFSLGLFFCALAYQVNRFGAAIRRLAPTPAALPPALLLGPDAPSVTVLIPTYREERRVLQMTVLSAALAQYGQRNIVVLVDDPPTSSSRPLTLQAVEDVQARLAEPMATLRAEAEAAAVRIAVAGFSVATEAARAAALYEYAADWLNELARDLRREESADFAHVDGFFVDDVVLGLANSYRRHGSELCNSVFTARQIADEYERLSRLFCDDIAVFERKQFANLSHAANKAMNLNSYIGLTGGRYDVREANDGWHLQANDGEDAAFEVPDTDYLLTLDADSVIRPSYLMDLVEIAEATPSAGVVQTPYLTFPGAESPVERIAGATTDIQYLVHQGSSQFGAAHWVGANALLRKSALNDIRVEEHDGEAYRTIFVQDRTVIEDTGSTVDLLSRGWIVYNHFKPLAFSATPADFGSLAIQRQRWSNGGLIIFPSLWRRYRQSGHWLTGLPEFLLRTHYLLSPLIGNVAVLMLMVLLLSNARDLLITSLAMAPYFLLYGSDLSRIGYRFRDLFAVSSLNLMLLPVSLAGVIASIAQLVTGRKAAFARTPKIAGRTAVHPIYILFNLGMFALMAGYTVDGIATGDFVATIVPAANVLLYGYGLWRFIGIIEGALDLVRPIQQGLARLREGAGRIVGARRPTSGLATLRMVGAWLLTLAAILAPASFRDAPAAKGNARQAPTSTVSGSPPAKPITATSPFSPTANQQ